ncbi:MAG: hypothetical protein JXR97_09715 [Planctomycetes bacterium]|nr:hypothetical protein [Planctomycetota bacterium]
MGEKPHILVCDGQGRRLEECLPVLRDLGYACTYIPDVASLYKGCEFPDLLVVSAEINGGPGGADFREITQTFPGVAVMAIAHVRSLSTAIAFFRAGVVDYLPVPFARDEASERIEAALLAPVDTVVEECAESEVLLAGQDMVAGAAVEREVLGLDLDVLPCGVLIFDSHEKLIQANVAAMALFEQPGLDEMQMLLAHHFDEYNPLDMHGRPVSPDNWPPRKALKEKAYRAATISLQRPDHTRIWLHMEASPQLTMGKVGSVALTLTNITEELAFAKRMRD